MDINQRSRLRQVARAFRLVSLASFIAFILANSAGCSPAAYTEQPDPAPAVETTLTPPLTATATSVTPPAVGTPTQPETPSVAPLLSTSPPVRSPIVSEAVRVTSVIDGDTIEVRRADGSTDRVRLIGVDSPESRNRVEPFGKEAADWTRRHLEGKVIYLEFDVRRTDRYDRTLAHVWLYLPDSLSEPEIRSKLFNAVLVINGYAHLMTIPPNIKYVDHLQGFEREARNTSAGLWSVDTNSGLGAGAPAAPAPRGAGGYVGSSRSDVFHYPDCQWAQRISPHNLISWPNRSAAVSVGRRPCKSCDP